MFKYMQMSTPEIFNSSQAADRLGVSRATLLRWFRDGRVSDVGRDWRGWRTFRQSDLDRILRELGAVVSSRQQGGSKMRGYLSRVPAFRALKDSLLQELAETVSFRGYLKREFVFQPGQTCTALHLVVKGKVRVFRLSPEGKESLLAVVVPYSTLGEAAIFGKGRTYSSFAQCERGTTILSLPFQKVQDLVKDYPDLALSFLAEFASRIQSLEQRLEEMAHSPLERRLANYLTREAGAGEEGRLHPNSELASLLGVTRASVSRTLNRFEELGWIERLNGKFRILDRGRLTDL